MKLNESILELALDKNKINTIDVLCSGGVDSISISYYILNFFKRKKSLLKDYNVNSFSLIHFNHNYRPQNEEMEYSVKKFCEDFSIPVKFEKIKHNCDITITEDYLRKCRYAHLMKSSPDVRELFNPITITGHHLDDACESHMLNVIRGKADYQPIPFITDFEGVKVCRPFIFNRKNDLISYAKKNNLMKYVVDDSTNYISKGSRRNMIRNEILPIFERDEVGFHTIVKKNLLKRLSLLLLKDK